MIGGLQGEFGDLDIKYLKQNISKCRSKYLKMSIANIGMLQENTAALCKILPSTWSDPGTRCQGIRTCLSREVETPPFLPSGVRCRMWNIRRRWKCLPDRIPDGRYSEKVRRRKGDRLRVQGVETPSPDDTERALLSGSTPSRFLKRTYDSALLSGLPQGEAPGTREHHTRTITYLIRICCPDHWL